MNWYKRQIGDYYRKTMRLSMLQHGAYILLMDACYDREKFPTLEEAMEWCWASTPEEEQAIKFILSRFFEEQDGVYVQKRIGEELKGYHAKSEVNKRIAQYREYVRVQKATGAKYVSYEEWNESCAIEHQPSANRGDAQDNQQPVTSNQEPVPTTSRKRRDRRFAEWWSGYPKKVNKKRSLEIWKRRHLDDQADILIADVNNRMTNDRKWIEGFIPMPTTYLNGDRWEDEIETYKDRPAAQLKLPSDEQLEAYALKHGLSKPRSGESFSQYRGRLSSEIELKTVH